MTEKGQETYQKIIQAAQEEFLKNGFEKASMRRIASQVGVSATALYRHFADKEALFSTLVAPALYSFLVTHAEHDEQACQLLVKEDPSHLWGFSAQEFRHSLDYVYDHYDAFKLLLCCAAGTKYQDFAHQLVEKEVDEMMRMRQIVKTRGIPVNEVDAKDLHLLMSGFFTSLFEMIIHDYSREEAIRSCTVLSRFFYAGLQAVMGF